MPIRNFLKRPSVTVEPAIDESRPAGASPTGKTNGGSQRPSLTIRRSADEEPNEFKMSVVDDSGTYLPPSPPEKRSFWSSPSRNSSRNLVNENEPFSISRESFDSYRRSFDISARSPVSHTDTAASRTSLDSRLSRPNPRSPNGDSARSELRFDRPKSAHEDDTAFEDVRLNDDTKPKKKGLFSRFGDSNASAPPSSSDTNRPNSSHRGFHLPGRKRGQSGQGAELANFVNPNARSQDTK